jgi:HEAT repeat protein
MLAVIWLLSLLLLLFSFGALAALIVARVSRERFERANPGRRARISRALLRYAVEAGPPPEVRLSHRLERQTLVETTLDAVQILRGPARARLVQYLRDIELNKVLRRMARTGSLRDKLMALEGLSFFPDDETVALLRRAEGSKDLRIWLAAVRSRAQIGPGLDILELLQAAERTGARRAPIMYDLIAARTKSHFSEALRALRGSIPPLTRALVIRALGETGRQEALDPLRVALHNPDAAVRSAAAGALGILGFDSAGEALARATFDPHWRVRLKAAEAIGQLSLWRHAEHLDRLLDDPVWWVRLRAEEALKRLGEFGERRLKEVGVPKRSASSC